MSKLDKATVRLNKALDALERTTASLAESRGEAAELLKERDTLLTRLAALEDGARSLSGKNAVIESRLDSAIEEIRAALGR